MAFSWNVRTLRSDQWITENQASRILLSTRTTMTRDALVHRRKIMPD